MGMLTNARTARVSRAADPQTLMGLSAAGASALGLSTPSQVNRGNLLRGYSQFAWVRLAADVVASRQSVAEWFLLLPARSSSTSTRLRLRRELDRAGAADALDSAARSSRGEAVLRQAVEEGDFEKVTRHPFLDMLSAGTAGAPPMMVMSGHEVDRLERTVVDLWGEFYYLLVRDATGTPFRWWPIPPASVRKPETSGAPFWVGSERIPQEDVAMYRQPRPEDFYGDGAGVMEALRQEVQLDAYYQAYMSALLRNRARPDLLIMAPGLGDAERERFETAWRQDLSGATRSGVAHFIGIPQGSSVSGTSGRGVVVKDLARSPVEMEGEEARKARRDIILQTWRTPQSVVGATESSNRAVAYMGEVSIRRNRTIPDLEARRNWLQQRFFEPFFGSEPEYPGGWILAYRLPSLDDPELRTALLTNAGHAFDQNEIRRAAGEQPRDGGEGLFFVPDGVTATRDPEALAETPVP